MGRQQTEGSLALQEKNVIVIEAAKRSETQKLRVAAYARVSSDSSDQLNSFMAQTKYYTNLITSHDNWMMTDIYADAGITGTSAEKRPEFQRMLSDCRNGRIDRILVKSISRFARNAKDCLEIIRALKAIGVSVHFEEQNIDTGKMSGELLTAMFAAISQKESESISGNMRWSYKQRMESGKFITCKAPFGYRLNGRMLEIYEPEAQIVHMIFDMYLSGYNCDEIADRMTELCIATRDGNTRWWPGAITYILRNERYVGDSLLQKRYTTDVIPYKKKRNYGEKSKYYLSCSHPAIVDRETFQAANNLLDARAKILRTKSENVLGKTIVCGKCGALFKHTRCNENEYWVCRNHFKDKNNCPTTQIPESEIHAAFLRIYHKMKLHGEPILSELLANLQTIRERRFLWSTDIIELNKRISDLTDQEHMLAEMNKNGLVAPDIFISQSNELARQITEAKQKKSKIMRLDNDNSSHKTEELLEQLENMPEYLPAFDSEIFEELVEQIVVTDNTQLRFRMKNGLELTERIERMMR